MRLFFRALSMAAMVAALVPVCGSAPGITKTPAEDIIVTAAPVYHPLAALSGEERFPEGAQLMLVHQGNAAPLVKGFAATADANVSFDGKSVLFAGNGLPVIRGRFGSYPMRMFRCASSSPAKLTPFVPSTCPLGSWFTHCERQRAINWLLQARMTLTHLIASRPIQDRRCSLFPIFRPMRFL